MNNEQFRAQVAILAGGMGERLKSRSGNIPKPMIPILGRPVLEHQIDLCRTHGFKRIALLVHYKSDFIRQYFGDGSSFGVQIEYSVEQEARGTAGAIFDALYLMDERFIVLYADTYVDVDLRVMWERHSSVGDFAGTLMLHPNDHPHDSDLVQIDDRQRVIAIHPYPHVEQESHRNLVNAALYVLERDNLNGVVPVTGKFDLAKHTFPLMLKSGLQLQAYVTTEYIKDMGTPERLDKVTHDISFGLSERLSRRSLRSAVFIDRDGTMIYEVNHLSNPDQIELIPGVGEAVRNLNRNGLLAVCITNQPVVARGDVSFGGLERIHARFDNLLGESHAYLDGLYVCPHHPDKGFPGEVAELKIKCDCRKPRTGLIDSAVRELEIDRRTSWMVGDTTADIEAGRRAGVRTILLRTGYAGLDGKYPTKPDYVVPDLTAAVDWILKGHGAICRQLFEVCANAANGRLALVGGPARAGKSSVSRVMAELISATGRTVHIISLDGWLLPEEKRVEGTGVLNRYDMASAVCLLLPLMTTNKRHWIHVPEYERKNRTLGTKAPISIGPDDFLIVEGVTALIENPLIIFACVRMFINVDDEIRFRRLKEEYAWRGEKSESIERRITSREYDELPIIKDSAKNATHLINTF